jgi:hypothetical protein
MATSFDKSESAILARALGSDQGNLTPELAEHVLTLGLTDADKQTANELAEVAKTGTLTEDQESELQNYRRAGRIFELLKSKARITLRGGQHTS